VIVYVESNFVLEVARRQDDSVSADAILALAESGVLLLAYPAFALAEPFSVARRAGADRHRLAISLRDSVHELGRSEPYRALAEALRPVVPSLLRIEREETDRLERTVARMLESGTRIDLDRAAFEEAQSFVRRIELTVPDAIILSCVLRHLRSTEPGVPKCFVSTNSKDFGAPAVRGELERLGCRYISRFADALAYLKSVRPGQSLHP
jgi:hypothetical protein